MNTRICLLSLALLSCVIVLGTDVVKDGFTAELQVDCSAVKAHETLYRYGALALSLRLAGDTPSLAHYDDACGNYLSFPLIDGTCPIIEATICAKGGRVGIPLSLFAPTGGTHKITLQFDGTHFTILAGDHLDDELPTAIKCPIVWPNDAKEERLSSRIKSATFQTPARKNVVPAFPDVRAITGTPQYWTPPAFNAWVGDVAVGVWKNRFHVFYLYDRRHHGSGVGTGRHYFAHIASDDLIHWVEHPLAVPVEKPWECTGTGTPFEYEGKFCLAYGLHTGRTTPNKDLVYAYLKELPPEKRGDGNFHFSDLPHATPVGGTYVESDDGIHFRKTGLYLSYDQNPSVYNRTDGRLGIGTWNGQLFVSRDGRLGHWEKDGARAPIGGDCPAPFTWAGRDYLLQGFYWMASRLPGGEWENWTVSGDDIYDGLCVPMVARWKDDRRILSGWLMHVHGWGGWLVFRELIRFPDGKLGMRWLKETPPPIAPTCFHVTDLTKPFVLRAANVTDAVTFRIDPQAARAQFAFGKNSTNRVLTATEIVAARPANERLACYNQKGNFAFKRTDAAIGKIRGLDKPFAVKCVQYYDAKSRATIFDMEIAGTRTFITCRAGRFSPLLPE